jgi:antitoxin (DNA-binding transcriptional repressor) of toxin-antitoxin stability system
MPSSSSVEDSKNVTPCLYGEPVAKLIPARPQYIHGLKGAGRGGIKPVLKRRAKIPYLEVLLEERGNR